MIRICRVAVRDVAEEFEPTPMMTDILITPTGQEVYGSQEKLKPPGTPFYHDCLPDTGFPASMISADLVRTYGLVLDRQRTRKLKNVNGTLVKVIGSVTFDISYEGANVEILALVSTDLSWKTLNPIRTEGVSPRHTATINACHINMNE